MSLAATQSYPVSHQSGGETTVVVIGTGLTGLHLAQKLLDRDLTETIALYGSEPWGPYNRMQLSTLLSGETSLATLTATARLPDDDRIVIHHNLPVVAIDRERRQIVDANQQRRGYSHLVIATGARPHVPVIPGIGLRGVYTFANLDDTQHLLARRTRSRHTVIVGGGVLGLEAARAMQRFNTEVTVVEHSTRLMNRQLDDAAGEMLREHLIQLGIRVSLSDGVRQVLGDNRVTGIELRSGRRIDCDTVVVVTGIESNIELARQCGLSVGRGIRVNDNMQTSDPLVYAIGDCAEHRERVYGMVAPGLEQAAVAAHSIMGGKARYNGSIVATSVKVIEQNVFSMGVTGDAQDSLDYDKAVFQSHSRGTYRKLILRRGRLVGAIAIGPWGAQARLQEAISRRRRLWPWQLYRFRRHGELWPERAARHVSAWPATTTVCNCRGITRGQLSTAIGNGCATLESLAVETGASTVCGSCKPLLAELVGSQAEPEQEPGQKGLRLTVILALLATLLTWLVAPVPYSDTMVPALSLDVFWRDGLYKQISGFTLLGLALVAMVLSLRKRVQRFQFGQFAWWRVLHAALGVAMLLVLFAHTGFRLGENLNLLLMTGFLLLGLTGAVAGGAVAVQDKLDPVLARRIRRVGNWVHLLLFWPLPALLGLHILAVYYF